MEPDRAREIAQAAIDAWNSHEPSRLGALYALHATYRDASSPEPAQGRGHIQRRAEMLLSAFPDIEVESKSLTVEDDRIVQEWIARGTHTGELMGLPATKKGVEAIGCAVMRVGEDGLIEDETNYWDYGSLLRQLEVLPDLGAAARS